LSQSPSTLCEQNHHVTCPTIFDLVVTGEKVVEEMDLDAWFDNLPSLSHDQTTIPLSLLTKQQQYDSQSLHIRRILVDQVIDKLCCCSLHCVSIVPLFGFRDHLQMSGRFRQHFNRWVYGLTGSE
jgi:hypothetical protein